MTVNAKPASKLSTEMFRTDSHDNIVSLAEIGVIDHYSTASSLPSRATDAIIKDRQHSLLAPPVIFPRRPGEMVKVIDMDVEGTPTPQTPPPLPNHL